MANHKSFPKFAGMKAKCFVIGVIVLFAFFACTSKVKAPEPAVSEANRSIEEPSPELSAIDSLMWQRPDSALACLLPYFDTCRDENFCVSTATEYNRHYANLLLSELLYKNDYAQVNRAELLQAVAYFDGLVCEAPPLKGGGGIIPPFKGVPGRAGDSKHNPNSNGNLVFLTARAHYINGVGYYENDSMVEACKEYLMALEVMEGSFEEKELIGKKAKFMTYTYNRLGDMFEEQLLAEPAIACYKQALFYCQRKPTSIYGIPVLFYNLGIQYDIANQKDSAAFYYEKALANMPDSNNIHYRDILTTQAMFAYHSGACLDSVAKNLKYVVSHTQDDGERLTRFLTIGNMLFEDKQYDSSRFYLDIVFEQQGDIPSKILAAEKLCSIYQIAGDSLKAQKYASFLADFTMAEIEKKKDVSKINEMFKNYLTQKQERHAEEEREKAIKKVIEIIVPIAVVVVLGIVVMAKIRSKKLLKVQQKESDRKFGESEQQHKEELRQKQAEVEKILEDKEKHHQQEMEAKEAKARKELEERDKRYSEAIEVERQTHRMKQAAISGRLKRSNQEVRELKDQIKQLDDLAAKSVIAASFDEEPVCRLIMERVKDGQFKSKIDYIIYKDSALNKQQLLDLRLAVDRHFRQFTVRLKKVYPELTNSDLDYCCLYLLGLTDADIAALMQRAYNTVIERNGKLKKIFGEENTLSVTLRTLANDSSFV